MDKQKLSEKFNNFLELEKNFPRKSLLTQAPAVDFNNMRLRAHLLLLDTRIGNYIGLVEFLTEINPEIKGELTSQIEIYLKAIKSESLPTYLVFPNENDDDFSILVFGDNDWMPITKAEFPEFETLSAKKKIEEKSYAKELEEKVLVEDERKKANKAKISLWTLSSLIAGLITAILTFYITIDNSKKDTNTTGIFVSTELDSIKEKIKSIDRIDRKSISKKDTLYIIDSKNNYSAIDNRLRIIEEGIINNTEKTLSLKNTQHEIDIINEQIKNQEKIIQLKNESLISRLEWLNAVVIGMVIALFSSAIGFVITNYNERKKYNR